MLPEFSKDELKAEIEMLQLKANRLKKITMEDFNDVHIFLVRQGIREQTPLIQSHFPFSLKQEFRILLEDSIAEYERLSNSLKTLL